MPIVATWHFRGDDRIEQSACDQRVADFLDDIYDHALQVRQMLRHTHQESESVDHHDPGQTEVQNALHDTEGNIRPVGKDPAILRSVQVRVTETVHAPLGNTC